MVAFQARSGRRIDFITINDPTSPTDTPEEFVALLQATADAVGGRGLLANQARLLLSLARHAGISAAPIAAHVTGQTRRTVRSSSAYQQVSDRHRPRARHVRQVHLRAGRPAGADVPWT